ncbi:MAG TPA: energy transducer TonB [Bacteroidales bacterium]
MKTRIATLLIVLGIFVAGSAFASNPVIASKAVSGSIAKQLKSEIKYPSYAVDEKIECCVVVRLEIQEDGTLDVIESNSMSKKMEKHVIKTIESMEANGDLKNYAGQNVLVKVRFELI